MLARILRELGFEVEEAADGGRLLVQVASRYKEGHSPEEIDLIVTDVRMPVVSGLEIFENVRAAHWHTPVLLVTAFPTSRVLDVAAKLGARLLVKPFGIAEFERAVLELVKGSPA